MSPITAAPPPRKPRKTRGTRTQGTKIRPKKVRNRETAKAAPPGSRGRIRKGIRKGSRKGIRNGIRNGSRTAAPTLLPPVTNRMLSPIRHVPTKRNPPPKKNRCPRPQALKRSKLERAQVGAKFLSELRILECNLDGSL